MDANSIRAVMQAAINEWHEPYTLEEVAAEIEAGRSTVFVGERSILVCQLSAHNGVITGHCWLGGGEMQEIRDVLAPQAEAWAKANGAQYATIDGRQGWARVFRDSGYQIASVTVRKEL